MNDSQNKTHRVDRRWTLSATRTITADEFREMVRICQSRAELSRKKRPRQRDLAILLLSGAAGLRVSEIKNLTVEDTENLAVGVLWVRTAKQRKDAGVLDELLIDEGTKVALERHLRTLPKEVREDPSAPLFRNEKSGEPLTTRAIQLAWAKYCRAAGIEYTGIHAGRHLVGTTAVQVGDIAFAKRRLRHRSLSSTLVYVHADFVRERELLEEARVV